jgi:alkanesulfonate monooxygenase SsuD/methylene tetrahydromethanopterin reductase-like flavin-dependent oxidoreductase (luciferase family)
MEFGVQFFPCVKPEEKSADVYWQEALALTALADDLGFAHVRTVEHYFHYYGGYSPNPLVFLAAAASITKRLRLVTGAVLPIFNHPLKLAGEIGMVDGISGGRLDVGIARAFLPHEFARFGVRLDESRARFEEGLQQLEALLSSERTSSQGQFHSFPEVTSLPRPTQRPRPPLWIAALSTPESFINAGRQGYHLMAIPLGGAKMEELLTLYRKAWLDAGHPGQGKIMLAFHMFCAPTSEEAVAKSRHEITRYLKSIIDGASDWVTGANSRDYPNYDKILAALAEETFESQVEKGGAWVGTPDEIRTQINAYRDLVGGFDSASLQVNFGLVSRDDAARSMRLFADEVMPHFRQLK